MPGRPLGAPHDVDFPRKVLPALPLFEEPGVPLPRAFQQICATSADSALSRFTRLQLTPHEATTAIRRRVAEPAACPPTRRL